jgi:hypothetical protein
MLSLSGIALSRRASTREGYRGARDAEWRPNFANPEVPVLLGRFGQFLSAPRFRCWGAQH